MGAGRSYSMARFLAVVCGLIFLPACQDSLPRPETQNTMFGRWRLDGAVAQRICEITLQNTPTTAGWEVTKDPSCPPPFSALHSWALYGDDLVLRNRAGEVVARFSPKGLNRYDGRTERGAPVSLTRG